MRKIIQIAVDAEGYFHALCDDGSVWHQYDQVVSGGAIMTEWRRFKDIPQDDAQEQESDVIDASGQEVRKPVSIDLTRSLILELHNSDLCNILSEVYALVYSQAEDCAREREHKEEMTRAEAEDCNEYQNYMLQCNMLAYLAVAVDIRDGADSGVRDEKRKKLINKLENIQVA